MNSAEHLASAPRHRLKRVRQCAAACADGALRCFRPARVAILAFIAVAAPSLEACSVPVFRYALDRWPADRFELEVAPADAKDERVGHFLRNFTDSEPLNLTIRRLPADSSDPSRLLPPHAESGGAVWSGSLDASALAALVDSPARKEIARRILSGDSAVWVLVTSGKGQADAAAAAALQKRLGYLSQVAQLPAIDPNDPSSKIGPGPALAVKFSMLQVDADDAAEKPFLTMLAGPNLDEVGNSGTWLAAVFGRGRVIGAWGARDFGDEQIDEISLFLLGACSCQVKRQNPGWDLLMNVDWTAILERQGVPALPGSGETKPPTATAATAPAESLAASESVTIAPPATPAPTATAPDRRGAFIAAAAAALLLVGAAKLAFAQKKS